MTGPTTKLPEGNGALRADAVTVRNPPRPAILVLDDDSFIVDLQVRMLQSMGYEHVRPFTDSGAALTFLLSEAGVADVIVSDLNMPGIDGIAFLRALAAHGYHSQVVLLSGEGTRIMHTVQKLLHGSGLVILGALEKPPKRSALEGILKHWKPSPVPQLEVPPVPITEVDLYAAIRNRELVLYYQPKIDLKSCELAGVEALLRWKHPVGGWVSPKRFISLAEECGAIDPLTDWVLWEAMHQLGSWQRAGLDIKMSVNLSTDNLRAPDFASRIVRRAMEAEVSPQNVILEITESRVMSTSPEPLECLVRLRLQRFGLSIDDFGTGHSSLAQLRDVPFTELKVDRGFVTGARNNQMIRPILDGSIGIARRMGMQSVGEGVETEEDWKLLRELGCDFAQGFLIGAGMAADRMPQWLAQWQTRRTQFAQG